MPYEEVKDAFRPESLLPLKISEPQARDLIRAWYGRQWLAPNALQREGAHRHGARRSTCRTGRSMPRPTRAGPPRPASTTTRARAASRCSAVRWTPASGELSHIFDDELVCASMGVDARQAAAQSSRFRPATLMPYDPGYLAGWTVERYQIDLVAAAAATRASRWKPTLRELCAAQVPGDTHRNLGRRRDVHRPDVQAHPRAGLAADLHLRREVVPGRRQRRDRHDRRRRSPWSWIKIALLVLLVLFIIYLIGNSSSS